MQILTAQSESELDATFAAIAQSGLEGTAAAANELPWPAALATGVQIISSRRLPDVVQIDYARSISPRSALVMTV